MGGYRKLNRILRVYLWPCCLLLSATISSAKLAYRGDYRDGILEADLVAIVVQESPDTFRVEEVLLGSADKSTFINLPGFRLFTQQQYGSDIVDPISPNTRILLYLRHKNNPAEGWEVTDKGYAFFWVQHPEDTPRLRSSAEKAIALRRQWEEVADIPNPVRRAEALWPFLSQKDYGFDFANHTKTALQKIAPASGDYFAERFDSMPTWDRMDLFRDAGAYGGDKLHEKLTTFIRTQQETYESYASIHHLTSHDPPAVWYSMPVAVRDSTGNVSYGLAGLASYHRQDDLPLIREIARWGVKFGQQQTSEAALRAFKMMPDQDNLPVIALIARKFRNSGDETFPIEVMWSLCAHKYVQTIPQLAPFVSYGYFGAEAEAALTEIVGRDLGDEPRPWLVWYKTRTAKTTATGTQSR